VRPSSLREVLEGLGLHVLLDAASTEEDVRLQACGVFPTGAVSVRVRPKAALPTWHLYGSEALSKEIAEVVHAFLEGRAPRAPHLWLAATSHAALALQAPTATVLTAATRRLAADKVGIPSILGVVMAVLGWCDAETQTMKSKVEVTVAAHEGLCTELLRIAAPEETRDVPLLCAALAAAALHRLCRDGRCAGAEAVEDALWRRAEECLKARAAVTPHLSAFEVMYVNCLRGCVSQCWPLGV
jgi:hypothetical protein